MHGLNFGTRSNPKHPEGAAWRTLTLVLLAGLLLAGPLSPGQADKSPEALTPEDRAKLAREALAFNDHALELFREGKYAAACRGMEQALKIYERLYPAAVYPNGHPDLAIGLSNLGLFLRDMGEYGRALPYLEQALAMRQKLYPAARFPDGHPDLANSLNNLGALLPAMGEYSKALPLQEKALAMYQKLYPAARFPDGHPDLAIGLNNLGILLQYLGEYEKALPYSERALAMRQKLYPAARFPDGHPLLATSLNNLGALLPAMGEYGKALPYCEKALAMYQKLFPAARFPDGHPLLATGLNNLGYLRLTMGEYGKALPYCERALVMRQKLYPAARYPDGHPDLATSLNNLGMLLQYMGEYGKALPYLEKALAMYKQLYPAARFPDGHPFLATGLNNLGLLRQALGEYGKALPYYEQALAMRQKQYPAARFPNGHPDLAISLNSLGFLLSATGEYARALPYCQQVLAMYQKLYPAARYPDGHPDLAKGFDNLGALLRARGEYGKALPFCEQALALYQKQFRAFADQAAEAEALAFAGILPLTRDALLSVAVHLPGSGAAAYRHVWQTKAALTRVLSHRHLGALAQADASATRKRWQELAEARRHLARLLAAPVRDVAARDREVGALTDRKEKLERELAATLPPLSRQQELDPLGPEVLAKRLPKATAFLDLLRYHRFEHDPKKPGRMGQTLTQHYVAFLLSPRRPVRRVELGPAEPIEKALRQWRGTLAREESDPAGQTLSRLLWQPITKHLPRETKRLYLSPDEDLAGLPWAALPISKGEVLLERYTLAVMSHGPFLLDQLLHPAQPPRDPGRLLALGGVQYGRGYPDLPGTRVELESVAARAGQRPLVRLDGSRASAARLVQELPRARYAHLATHGFFNETAYQQERDRQTRQWQTWQFDQNHTTERIGQGARNPLGFTGLVLAGEGPGAIMTGESLVELPLEGLHLAVLSACETGLGARVVGGEVHGLQRAFHLAGCRNVVVSLWQVPDVPTLVLMEEFYKRLWDEKKPLPPAEALRQAQLTLLRHPEKVIQRARKLKAELVKRGASADQLRGIQKVLAPLPEGGKNEELKHSPPLWWAGFVLSGDGK